MSAQNNYPNLKRLADQVFYKSLMEKYDGEVNLRNNYPLIIEGFEKIKNLQESTHYLDNLGTPIRLANDLENYIYIAYAYYDATNEKFHIKPVFTMLKKVHATFEITIKSTTLVYGQNQGEFKNKHFYAEEIVINKGTREGVPPLLEVLVRGTFIYDGMPYPYDRTINFSTSDIYNENATVIEPIKHGGKSDNVIIYYGRLPGSKEAVDHNYPDALENPGRNVKIHLPICGSIPLKKGTPYIKEDKSNLTVNAILDFKCGVVSYSQDLVDVSQTPQNFSWLFQTDWKKNLVRDHFNPGTTAYLSVYFSFEVSGVTERYQLYLSSLATDIQSKSVSSLKTLQLEIGCVQKGSLISMNDGSKCAVENVKIGNRIRLPNGSGGTVTNTMQGTERELVYVTTKSGDALGLSANHRIQTKTGITEAINLTANMEIAMADGSFSPIEFLYLIEYSDMVYNLFVDCGDAHKRMICNNMIVSEAENAPDVRHSPVIMANACNEELFNQVLVCSKKYGY